MFPTLVWAFDSTVVEVSAQANYSWFTKTGTLAIAGQTVTVPQATYCPASLSPASQTFPPSGGNAFATMTMSGPCTWIAYPQEPCIVTTGVYSATSSGSLNYTVLPNPNQSPRSS
jgi:hypothetical protein